MRGTGTVLGDADPLYMVDGVIVNNDSPELIRLGGGAQNRLIDLNLNDVERIEIVKGAAAAALYGSRANNGVVQIFTKRGVQGKPRITYTSRLSTSKIRKTLPVNRTPVDNRGNKNSDGSDVQRFDHQDFIFRRAAGMEHYASVSGGSGNTRSRLLPASTPPRSMMRIIAGNFIQKRVPPTSFQIRASGKMAHLKTYFQTSNCEPLQALQEVKQPLGRMTA